MSLIQETVLKIRKSVGGDLVSLELEKPYLENYQVTVVQVATKTKPVFVDFEN